MKRHFVGARLTNCGGWGCLHRVVLGPKILRKSRDWKSLIPMEPAPPPPLPHAVNAVNERFCKYFATKVFFDGEASDRADSAFSRQHCLGKTTKGNNAFNRKLSVLSLHAFLYCENVTQTCMEKKTPFSLGFRLILEMRSNFVLIPGLSLLME